MEVLGRYHEGREFPSKSLFVKLKKGFTVEVCDWSPIMEDVSIYEKLVLDDFKYSDDKTKLELTFRRINLRTEDKKRYHLINMILDKHFAKSKYGLVRSFVDSIEKSIIMGEISPKDLKGMEEKINGIEKNKIRVGEIPGD